MRRSSNKSKQECILSCCRKTKKFIYAERWKNSLCRKKEHAIIGEPEFCDLITNAGKLDKVRDYCQITNVHLNRNIQNK